METMFIATHLIMTCCSITIIYSVSDQNKKRKHKEIKQITQQPRSSFKTDTIQHQLVFRRDLPSGFNNK
jgi:hypothetical protein